MSSSSDPTTLHSHQKPAYFYIYKFEALAGDFEIEAKIAAVYENETGREKDCAYAIAPVSSFTDPKSGKTVKHIQMSSTVSLGQDRAYKSGEGVIVTVNKSQVLEARKMRPITEAEKSQTQRAARASAQAAALA